jgi:hypothetical protein
MMASKTFQRQGDIILGCSVKQNRNELRVHRLIGVQTVVDDVCFPDDTKALFPAVNAAQVGFGADDQNSIGFAYFALHPKGPPLLRSAFIPIDQPLR